MIHSKPDSNFYSLGGVSVHENRSEEYTEYRRCWNEYPSEFALREFPMHLDIEATNRCNLKCRYCDKLPFVKKGQIGDINLDLFRSIIDEGAEHNLWGVKLSYRGEPLLHRNITEMVYYAKKKGILDVYFNTNGMLLNKNICNKLIEAGLDRISVSVFGDDKESFERERVGAKFDIILRNIDSLLDLREQKGTKYPKVRVQTVNFHNLDVDKYKAFWTAHSDEVAAIDYKDSSKREEGPAEDWACPQLWQRMTIEWDGTVFPCNNDELRLLSPGNINSNTIYECWHNKNVESVRSIHQKGQSHKVKACNGCPLRTSQIKK